MNLTGVRVYIWQALKGACTQRWSCKGDWLMGNVKSGAWSEDTDHGPRRIHLLPWLSPCGHHDVSSLPLLCSSAVPSCLEASRLLKTWATSVLLSFKLSVSGIMSWVLWLRQLVMCLCNSSTRTPDCWREIIQSLFLAWPPAAVKMAMMPLSWILCDYHSWYLWQPFMEVYCRWEKPVLFWWRETDRLCICVGARTHMCG